MLRHGFKLINTVKSEVHLVRINNRTLTGIKGTKNFSSMIDENYSKEPVDIEINVPYGHISGKIWNTNGKAVPILALHGWLDNLGSLEPLAPLINSDHPLVAIDFPGHGLSSHQPPGAGGYFTDHVVSVERVVDHFQWKELILLGHSMGGGVGLLYAGTFPERIKKLIMLDMLKPIECLAEDQPAMTAKFLTELFRTEKMFKTIPPRYELDDLVEKLLNTYLGSLTKASAEILLKRGAKKHSDGKYFLRYSPMLKIPSGLSMTFEQQMAFAGNVTCDMLLVKSSIAPIFGDSDHNAQVLNSFKKTCSSFRFEVADGTHHFHLNDPQSVSSIINDFLHGVPQSDEKRIEGEKYIQDNL